MVIMAAALIAMCILYYMFDTEEKIEAAQRKQYNYEKFLIEQSIKKKFK